MKLLYIADNPHRHLHIFEKEKSTKACRSYFKVCSLQRKCRNRMVFFSSAFFTPGRIPFWRIHILKKSSAYWCMYTRWYVKRLFSYPTSLGVRLGLHNKRGWFLHAWIWIAHIHLGHVAKFLGDDASREPRLLLFSINPLTRPINYFFDCISSNLTPTSIRCRMKGYANLICEFIFISFTFLSLFIHLCLILFGLWIYLEFIWPLFHLWQCFYFKIMTVSYNFASIKFVPENVH